LTASRQLTCRSGTFRRSNTVVRRRHDTETNRSRGCYHHGSGTCRRRRCEHGRGPTCCSASRLPLVPGSVVRPGMGSKLGPGPLSRRLLLRRRTARPGALARQGAVASLSRISHRNSRPVRAAVSFHRSVADQPHLRRRQPCSPVVLEHGQYQAHSQQDITNSAG
jgi:hypothetical protein